jgi:hypothetical protein
MNAVERSTRFDDPEYDSVGRLLWTRQLDFGLRKTEDFTSRLEKTEGKTPHRKTRLRSKFIRRTVPSNNSSRCLFYILYILYILYLRVVARDSSYNNLDEVRATGCRNPK